MEFRLLLRWRNSINPTLLDSKSHNLRVNVTHRLKKSTDFHACVTHRKVFSIRFEFPITTNVLFSSCFSYVLCTHNKKGRVEFFDLNHSIYSFSLQSVNLSLLFVSNVPSYGEDSSYPPHGVV